MKNCQTIKPREIQSNFIENCNGAIKFVLSTLFFVLFLSSISAQSIDGCSGTIFDSGGAVADYANDESITTTYCSDMGNQIKLTFSSFDVEENFDFLLVYDGADANSPILGVFTGANSPGAVVSTNGCITLVFESDGNTTGPGYEADITCVADCDVSIDMLDFTSATCMNSDGIIDITASGAQGTIEYSIDGGLTFGSMSSITGLAPGKYIVSARYDDGTCETARTPVLIASGCVEICGNGIDDDMDGDTDMVGCENTIVGCSGTFTDDGGAMGNYSPNLDTIFTFCADNGGRMEMTFTEFSLALGAAFDSLFVFDGPDINSPSLGGYFGQDGGVVNDQFRARSFFQSTGECLTFRFVSGPFSESSGWNAFYTCSEPATNFGTEICGNGIDDDGDGMIDNQDPDCPVGLDPIVCEQGFDYYVPPVWQMSGIASDYIAPSILCLSTSFPEATVTIETADGSYSNTLTLNAGSTDTLRFDDSFNVLLTDMNNTVETNRGLIVTSDFPIQVLYILDGDLNKNLLTIKGQEAKGRSFRVGTQTRTLVQPPTGIVREEHHFISVMAVEDGTNVTITTDKVIQGQTSPINIMLDAGETYLVINDDFNVTLTGALVTSDKDIVVASGSQHTSAYGVTEDDGGVDQLVPVRSIGTDYILVRGEVTPIQDYGIVVATENNTVVSVDGTPVITLNAGEYYEVDVTGTIGTGTYINGSKPIYVYHVSGLTLGEVGMALLAPIGQCRGDLSTSFARADVGAAVPDECAVNIVIIDAGLASLELNGVNVASLPTTTILPVAAFPGYSTVTIRDADIAAENLLESDEFFNAAVIIGNPSNTGTYGSITSFSEKINILDPFLNESVEFYVLDTICADSSLSHTLNVLSCGSTEKIRTIDQGALGTATITGDLSFDYTSNGMPGDDVISVTVVNDFGIQSTVCIGIRIDTLLVEFAPNDTIACSGETLTLELDTIGSVGPYSYMWSTGETTPTIDVTPTATTTYTVTVADAAGCIGVDSVRVELQMTVTADAGEDQTVCSGDDVLLSATMPMSTDGMWTGGTGAFSDDTSPTATYTPGAGEDDGMFTLYWTLSGGTGMMCFDGVDSIIVTVTPALDVDAGDDTYICAGSSLDLADLNSQINTTAAFTAFYTTDGDGVFMPGATASGEFGVATSYVPGVNDIENGQTILTLTVTGAAMDACANGVDEVILNIEGAPVLVCNDNLNISVNSECLVELNVDMLIESPIEPEDFYIITLKDEFGNVIPGMTLNSSYINRTIEYSVEYECGGNSCWGYITIEDKQIPDLEPGSRIVDCRVSTDPSIADLPLPAGVNVFASGDVYFVENFDPCSNVTLTYEDEVVDNGCSADFETTIFRTYTATDASGNSTTAVDTVFVERITLADLVLPPNYDDIDQPSLSCSADFEKLDNGNPSPTVTGMPDAGLCSKFESTYTDLEFEMCGNTFKVVREWIIYDWCTSESIEFFQTIKITDKTDPTISCPADVTVSSDANECNSGLVILQQVEAEDNCSSVTIDAVVTDADGNNITVNSQNGNLFVADLPLGISTVRYIVTDECGLTNDACTYDITVFDDVPPTPVCETHTKVSLNNVGTARVYAISLDDGSHDNCEIATIEVAKMTDQCGFGALNFGDYVDFCCNEIGDPVMVALQITDIYGNENVCMVEVELEDKIAPVIEAPSDLTISCTTGFDENDLSNFGKVVQSQAAQENIEIFDDFNNGVAGIDGIALDNCEVTIEEEIQIDIDCGVGEIRRLFTAIDGFGLKQSDVQIITVNNADPFNINDIIFPPNANMSGCMNLDTDPSNTGFPTILNEDCASIVMDFEDKTFETVDSACVLVVRTWKVIDMCQFNANTQEGVFTGVQSIKLNNTIAPTITSTCQDTVVCIYGECEGNVELEINAFDDCTDVELLNFNYYIDKDNDGNVDFVGTNNRFIRKLSTGTHSVRWTVEDLCGNMTECSFEFEVVDCKNPTPYCLGGVATALMNNVGEVEVSAETFDLGSFDNCTEQENLQFSFSSNTSNTTMLFTCDMLENGVVQTFERELWVTDEAGNQDFCTIQIKVQDNFDVCDNAGSVTIGGAVYNVEDEKVSGTDVFLSSDYPEANGSLLDTDGDYAFNSMPMGVDYLIEGYKNDDMLNGITVLDIVLVQKHILGLKPFDSPYKYIAADVNDNGKVNGVDIVQIRKALLNYYDDEFPDNTSWKFVDKSFDFDESDIFNYPESVVLNELNQDVLNADLRAVKIADINQSAEVDGFTTTSVETRDMLSYTLKTAKVGDKIAFIAQEDILVSGFQLELNVGNNSISLFEQAALNINEAQVRVLNNTIRIAYHNTTSDQVVAGDVLFYIGTDDNEAAINNVSVETMSLYPEMYNDELDVFKLNISTREDVLNVADVTLYQNTPNPFQKSTLISWEMPTTESIDFEIMDNSGRLMMKRTITASKGTNVIELDRNEFQSAGVYFYTIKTSYGSFTKKMILMN